MFCILKSTALVVSCALLLSACVVVPKRVSVYDPKCRVERKQLTLVAWPEEDETCDLESNKGLASCLALNAAIGLSSAIVSGSVVVVGNSFSWLERQGKCKPEMISGR